MPTTNKQQFWRLRAKLLEITRRFFMEKDFLEVQTPHLVPCPGSEVHLDYFATHWRDMAAKSHKLFLRSSPELHLKKLISQDMPRIFEIGTCYRNGGELTDWHHPEFNMLEWYQVAIGFEDFIQHTFEYLKYCSEELAAAFSTLKILPIKNSWQKFSVYELFEREMGFFLVDEDPELAGKARAKGAISVKSTDDFETAFFKIQIDRLEPALKKHPICVLYDYPPSMAALAKIEKDRAKRFEFYVQGIELSNGFLELLDAQENRQRFSQSNQRRERLGKDPLPEDKNFFQALENGMPPSCGNALGLDRWLALLLGRKDIASVIPFRENFNP